MPNALSKTLLAEIKKADDKFIAELFAPVVYFADDEKWLPADMESFYSIAGLNDIDARKESILKKDLFRLREQKDHTPESWATFQSVLKQKVPFSGLKTIKEKNFVLRHVKHGHDYYLNVPLFDLERMIATTGSGPQRHGGRGILDAATIRLGNNKPGYKGCCYAKVRRLGRPVKFSSAKRRMKEWYNGSWTIIHYFFFYSFNYSTNVHEGDWDSSITVCVNTDNGHVFATYNQHHTIWFTRLNVAPGLTQKKWLEGWTKNYDSTDNKWKEKEHGLAFGMGQHRTHPVGIVAGGSHGVYPTPGTVIFGISIPFRKDLPFTVDDRHLGFAIGPKNLATTPAGFPKTKFKWDKIVLIDDEPGDDLPQSPLAFKGRWGEVSPTREGWDGPKSPLFSDIWGHCDRTGHFERLLTKDYKRYQSRYSQGGNLLANVMLNTHRV
jgi:hypothetical protein